VRSGKTKHFYVRPLATVSIATPLQWNSPPATQTQLRALRANYVWEPATRKPQVCVFAGQEEPTSAVRVSRYDYLKLIFTDDLLQLLVTEINRCSAQSIGGKDLKPKFKILTTNRLGSCNCQ